MIEDENKPHLKVRNELYALSVPLVGLFYHVLCKKTGREIVLKTFIDDMIPFNKYFVIFYISWYFYMIYFIVDMSKRTKDNFLKLVFSLTSGMGICYIIYIFLPTYVPRPLLSGNDIFTVLVQSIYLSDNPYNCFPSIHVMASILIAAFVLKEKEYSLNIKIISAAIASLITLSTLFIKQHYLIDVVSGAALAFSLQAAADGLLYQLIKWKAVIRKFSFKAFDTLLFIKNFKAVFKKK